jgi:hypothetical protein
MERYTLNYPPSEAYEMGYYAGYSRIKARPEDFPSQQSEYLKGYSKGWLDGQRNQSCFTPFIV